MVLIGSGVVNEFFLPFFCPTLERPGVGYPSNMYILYVYIQYISVVPMQKQMRPGESESDRVSRQSRNESSAGAAEWVDTTAAATGGARGRGPFQRSSISVLSGGWCTPATVRPDDTAIQFNSTERRHAPDETRVRYLFFNGGLIIMRAARKGEGEGDDYS